MHDYQKASEAYPTLNSEQLNEHWTLKNDEDLYMAEDSVLWTYSDVRQMDNITELYNTTIK